jgi:hypothetical protein
LRHRAIRAQPRQRHSPYSGREIQRAGKTWEPVRRTGIACEDELPRSFFEVLNNDLIERWICGRHTRLRATGQNLPDTSMVN